MTDEKINVMVNGLPGKMATLVAERVLQEKDMKILDFSLTGPEIKELYFLLKGRKEPIIPVRPDEKETNGECFYTSFEGVIGVDFTQPNAVNDNAEFYCRNKLPFVMGTTGGDRKKLGETVKSSEISAVIAPNMAEPIVALQDFLEQYANQNPGIFKKCRVEVEESHQATKQDPSGTAIQFSKYFGILGIPGMPFTPDAIKEKFKQGLLDEPYTDKFGNTFKMIRSVEEQIKMGVPREYLGGHGWHSYKIKALDESNVLNSLKMQFENFFKTSPAFNGYNSYLPVTSHLGGRLMGRKSPEKDVIINVQDFIQDECKIIHNINGRGVYVIGTIDAIRYLDKRVKGGSKGQVYSMIDVLKVK